MMRGDWRGVRVIERLERRNSSVNGNPAWRVFFEDGSDAVTTSDAGWSYEASNRDNLGVPLMFTFTQSGRIRFGRKLTDADNAELDACCGRCANCSAEVLPCLNAQVNA